MPKHTLAHAMVGILVMPGLIFAGYPDVPRSHWAAHAVDKVKQLGVMTSRSDGRFHGGNPATRYEVASAIAHSVAAMENRLVADGHSPQDIVPYIERINLYVADEIDQLKQAQKELRAAVNELLERMERREAHSTPLPPPCAPMAHPHVSPVPHTHLRSRTAVHAEQRIHAVDGAVPVNATPTAHQHTQQALTHIRARMSEGKIGAVEGAAPVVETPAQVSEEKSLRESFAKRASQVPAAPAVSAISDEAAWEKSASTSAKEEIERAKMEDEQGVVAADETQPDIASAERVIETDFTLKGAAPRGAKKAGKQVEKKTGKAGKSLPMQNSKKPAPRAAPMPVGLGPRVDVTHGAMTLPVAAPMPFGVGEHDAAPVYPGQHHQPGKANKAKAPKVKASYTEPAAPSRSPIVAATTATAIPLEAAEFLDTPDIAPGDGPSDEQLSNWKPGDTAVPAAATSIVPAPATTTVKVAIKRSTKTAALLAELRTRVPVN